MLEFLLLIFLLLFLPFVIIFLIVFVASGTLGMGAFLSAGSERKEHPWKTWGLDEPKDDEEQ